MHNFFSYICFYSYCPSLSMHLSFRPYCQGENLHPPGFLQESARTVTEITRGFILFVVLELAQVRLHGLNQNPANQKPKEIIIFCKQTGRTASRSKLLTFTLEIRREYQSCDTSIPK